MHVCWSYKCVGRTGVLVIHACWPYRCVSHTGVLVIQLCQPCMCVGHTNVLVIQVCWLFRCVDHTGVFAIQENVEASRNVWCVQGVIIQGVIVQGVLMWSSFTNWLTSCYAGSENLQLIFEYAEWVIQQNPEDGLKVLNHALFPG